MAIPYLYLSSSHNWYTIITSTYQITRGWGGDGLCINRIWFSFQLIKATSYGMHQQPIKINHFLLFFYPCMVDDRCHHHQLIKINHLCTNQRLANSLLWLWCSRWVSRADNRSPNFSIHTIDAVVQIQWEYTTKYSLGWIPIYDVAWQ